MLLNERYYTIHIRRNLYTSLLPFGINVCLCMFVVEPSKCADESIPYSQSSPYGSFTFLYAWHWLNFILALSLMGFVSSLYSVWCSLCGKFTVHILPKCECPFTLYRIYRLQRKCKFCALIMFTQSSSNNWPHSASRYINGLATLNIFIKAYCDLYNSRSPAKPVWADAEMCCNTLGRLENMMLLHALFIYTWLALQLLVLFVILGQSSILQSDC